MAKNANKTPTKRQRNANETPDDVNPSIWVALADLQDDTTSNIQVDIERLSPITAIDAQGRQVMIRGMIDQLTGPIALDEFKQRYGGGQYKITIRKNGRYHTSGRDWIPGLPKLDEAGDGVGGQGSNGSSAQMITRVTSEAGTRKSYLEEMLLMRKLFESNGNGKSDILDKLILKLIDKGDGEKSSLNDQLKTMTSILGFTESLAKKIQTSDYEPTLEGEIAKNIPGILELLQGAKEQTEATRTRISQPQVRKKTGGGDKPMDDMKYFIFKTAAYIKEDGDPDQSVDLALDILNDREIEIITSFDYAGLKKALYPRLPDSIKKIFDSERGKKYITKFLRELKKTWEKEKSTGREKPSQTASPASSKKPRSSGASSSKAGRTRSSGSARKK